MNLYRISQSENRNYDTYDSAVVAADSPEDAQGIHPGDYGEGEWTPAYHGQQGTWVWDKSKVTVELIGMADPSIKRGVILASFNAG